LRITDCFVNYIFLNSRSLIVLAIIFSSKRFWQK